MNEYLQLHKLQNIEMKIVFVELAERVQKCRDCKPVI